MENDSRPIFKMSFISLQSNKMANTILLWNLLKVNAKKAYSKAYFWVYIALTDVTILLFIYNNQFGLDLSS